jgi:CubicO group peptidase (beta-lactamase class C family)
MTATSGDLPDAEVPGRVSFYTTWNGRYADAQPQNTSYKWAGGGIVSSALDLVRMGRALADTQIVSAATRELIWAPIPLADGSANAQNYALGWRRDTSTRLLGEDRPVLLLHHGGRQVGGVSFLMVLPERRIVVAGLTNTGSQEAREAIQELTYDLARLAVDGEIRAAP